jgi:outer membrane protein assembly factor BamB
METRNWKLVPEHQHAEPSFQFPFSGFHARGRQAPVTFLLIFLLTPLSRVHAQDWPQWGGPQRNFHVAGTSIASVWPAEGPKKLWSRELGEGYSAISAAGGKLFTMIRRGEHEIVVALDASTGKTLWEHALEARFSAEYSMENGPGPHASPLVADGRVFAVGSTGKLRALDAATGKLLWTHNLMEEFHGTLQRTGYASSPMAWKDMIIVKVGGPGNSLVAFKQSDGSIVWKKHSFDNSPSSPLLINVSGQPQLVAFMCEMILGVNPDSGELLWSHPHKTEYGLNVSLPIWGEDNLLFVSSAYDSGSRVLRVTREGETTKVEEIWYSRLMRIHFGNAIRLGDLVYGSSGDFGPAPLTAVDIKSGRIAWRNRALARANLLAVGGKLLLLDEDGTLALATPTADGLTIHARASVLSNNAWTVPTLVGSTLYLRDRKHILALDLK